MKKGLTLVEVLVVVCIILIVLGLLIPVISSAQKIASAKALCEDVAAKVVRGEAVPETLDPWGTPIQIFVADTTITVVSAGPDKSFETNDDILCRRYLKISKVVGRIVGQNVQQFTDGFKQGVKAEKAEK